MRPLLLLFALLSLSAPASAQEILRAGERVHGELAPSDSLGENGSRYDAYRFRAEPGHVYSIHLSTGVDATLAVGPRLPPGCETECMEVEDRDKGRDFAVLPFIPDEAGMVQVRVATLRRGESGHYELFMEDDVLQTVPMDSASLPAEEWIEPPVVEPDTRPPDWTQAPPAPIGAGEPVKGQLGLDGRQETGGYALFNSYSYRGRAGEQVTLRIRADSLDVVLRVGRWRGGAWEELESAVVERGTDGKIMLTLPDHGEYEIDAIARYSRDRGRYTLSVDRR